MVCLNTCKSLYCGDGFVDLDGPDNDLTTVADNEACDDGNTLLGDGCNDVCQLEAPDVLCEEEFTCPVGYILKYVTQTQQYYCEQTQYTGATYTP
ncbi:MAG: hypothetical protein Q8O99_07355 [bacterium]|nr:hypothetical protein [bacterium]